MKLSRITSLFLSVVAISGCNATGIAAIPDETTYDHPLYKDIVEYACYSVSNKDFYPFAYSAKTGQPFGRSSVYVPGSSSGWGDRRPYEPGATPGIEEVIDISYSAKKSLYTYSYRVLVKSPSAGYPPVGGIVRKGLYVFNRETGDQSDKYSWGQGVSDEVKFNGHTAKCHSTKLPFRPTAKGFEEYLNKSLNGDAADDLKAIANTNFDVGISPGDGVKWKFANLSKCEERVWTYEEGPPSTSPMYMQHGRAGLQRTFTCRGGFATAVNPVGWEEQCRLGQVEYGISYEQEHAKDKPERDQILSINDELTVSNCVRRR